MKKIKLIKIISSISTLGILGLAVGVNTTSCAEKTGVASIHAFLDTETLVQGDNSSIILHVYEMNVLKWVEPKIEFNHGGKSSHGLVVTKKFQLDKLGTYKIKASGVETGAYNIKVSVDGIKGSSNLTLEVTDPNKITSISIQGLNTVAGTRGIATAQAAVYHAMANGKILANDKVA
jgi:hypothetical protein